MHNSMNPYGGVNPLIDKMIGNAYDIVKYVARYLKEIRYVAENMESVYNAANGTSIGLTVPGDGVTTALSVALPAEFPYATIESVSVIAVYNDETFTFSGSDTFSYVLSGGNVNIQIHSALAQVLDATFRITAIYR